MSFEELFRRRQRKPPAVLPKRRRRLAPASLLVVPSSRSLLDYFRRPHKRFIPRPLRPSKPKRVQNKALIPDKPPSLCATALVTEWFSATALTVEQGSAAVLVTDSLFATVVVADCPTRHS